MSRPARFAFLSHLDLNLVRFRMPIMKELARRGVEVYALCPDGDFTGRFAAEGIKHVSYRVDRASLNPLKEAFVVAEIARRLRELRPDLLHTFMMKPNIYGALAASWTGVPARVASVTGLGSYYDGGPSTLKACVFRRGLDALYAAALRRVGRVIFYNTDDRDEFLKLGVASAGQSVLIPGSGVDSKRFSPAPRLEGGPVVVTMIARLILEKGVDDYLTAAETLKKRWGDKAVFQLAGEEDPGNPRAIDRERLESFVSRGVIRRLGFVDDVPAVLHGSDIYALPSYYREGLPVSVLEAMSCGLAVVTTDSVGCRDSVVPDQSGLLVPPKNPQALAAALDRLIGDAALRRRLGDAARRRVEEVFAAEKIVEAHFAVYRELAPGLL